MPKTSLLGDLVRTAHANPDLRPHLMPIIKEAGCDKLPAGPMRENCEKAKKEGPPGKGKPKGKSDKDDDKGGKKKDDGKMPAELLEKFKAKKKADLHLLKEAIRLAHDNPGLRATLLPIIRQARSALPDDASRDLKTFEGEGFESGHVIRK